MELNSFIYINKNSLLVNNYKLNCIVRSLFLLNKTAAIRFCTHIYRNRYALQEQYFFLLLLYQQSVLYAKHTLSLKYAYICSLLKFTNEFTFNFSLFLYL